MVDPHGSRMALASQRCWYGSLLTDSVRRGVFFAPVPAGAANGLEEGDQPLNADHTKIYHNINYILLNAKKLD